MYKLLSSVLLVMFTLAIQAQQGAKPVKTTKPGTKPATAPPVALKNLADSAGYALGVNIGTSLKMQSMTSINSAMITRAINDVLKERAVLLDDNTAFMVLSSYSAKMQQEKSLPQIKAGRDFLAKNKLRPEVKTTASGLQYEIITEGTGIKPTTADTFVVHYRGKLIDGTEFESSYNRNQPLTYPMTSVIPGWTEGLQLMSVGSKYTFYIPYELGYGLNGNGPVIPGGATLIFDLELLDVKKKQ